MAVVNIHTLWYWRCPQCTHWTRHWYEEMSLTSAQWHLNHQHDLIATSDWEYGPDAPRKRTWAFNIRPGGEYDKPRGPTA